MFTKADVLTDEQPTLFIDLSGEVYDFVDKGAVSIACHPNYPEDPFIYMLMSADEDANGVSPAYHDNCPS